jgi:hypothetical protein
MKAGSGRLETKRDSKQEKENEKDLLGIGVVGCFVHDVFRRRAVAADQLTSTVPPPCCPLPRRRLKIS